MKGIQQCKKCGFFYVDECDTCKKVEILKGALMYHGEIIDGKSVCPLCKKKTSFNPVRGQCCYDCKILVSFEPYGCE